MSVWSCIPADQLTALEHVLPTALPMISDSELNTVVLTFGFVLVALVLVYHALLVNVPESDKSV